MAAARTEPEKKPQRRKPAEFNELSGTILIQRSDAIHGKGLILIVSAGTSDIPVAEEALVTARAMGNRTEAIYDVGVAGLHRLLEHRERLTEARVIICVAGMEGALPSVVAGLVSAPVIAVPTSTGYGSSFGGLTALLAMLNSCASNVSVVNIDNGFGAGRVASAINRALALYCRAAPALRRARPLRRGIRCGDRAAHDRPRCARSRAFHCLAGEAAVRVRQVKRRWLAMEIRCVGSF